MSQFPHTAYPLILTYTWVDNPRELYVPDIGEVNFCDIAKIVYSFTS